MKSVGLNVGKDHSKAITAFGKDIEKLRPEQIDGCQIVQRDFKTKEGNIYKTYEVVQQVI